MNGVQYQLTLMRSKQSLNVFRSRCISKLDHGAYLAIFQAVSIEALRTELMQLETKISKTFPYVSQSLNLETSLKTGYCLIPSQVEHTESLENYINKALHQALPHKETTQASPKAHHTFNYNGMLSQHLLN